MAPFASKPLFKYLDVSPIGSVGGRGGAVRFYMLTSKTSFDEELVSFSDWRASEKAKCIEEYNPAGSLPVLIIDNKPYPEHISMLRYLARQNGEYGKDAEIDFIADAAADAYAAWRNHWADLLGKPEGDEAVKEYRATKRCGFYNTQEWYYSKKSSPSSPYLAGGSSVGFVDALVFNMVRDDGIKHTPMDLSTYPNLKAMCEAVGSHPEVKAWTDEAEARAKANAA